MKGTALLLCLAAALSSHDVHGEGESLHEQCRTAKGVDEACVFERLDSEDKLRDAFGAVPVRYRVHAPYLVSQQPPLVRDVTLVTQGSTDRLPRLREQALSWQGSISAAIYLRPSEQTGDEHEAVLARIRSLHREIESAGRSRLCISLVYAVDPRTAELEYDTLYPINALRNVAVRQAEAALIMVIDIDFVPSHHFWTYLTDETRYAHILSRAQQQLHVWALVSLELHQNFVPLPMTLPEVAAALENKSVVVAEAYLNPAAHMPVGVEAWLQKQDIYGPLEASEAFEPFVLGARLLLPLYDERFRGYGWDKTTHAAQLRKEGFTYYMLPFHFVVARYHAPTPTAVRIFGEADATGDSLLRLRMEWLFNSFLAELDVPGYKLPQVSEYES